ncbi:MAG TPA: ester cyclase [Candidatus Sulfotelmatobacter sp.]|nr:ester cyclase [Candidatus Sulfotelmatobacter sp.]
MAGTTIRVHSVLFTLLALMFAVLPASAAPPNALEKNKAVARRVFDEIFNQGKFDVADEIYATNFVNHGVHRDAGLKEDQDAARGWKLAFPDLKMTVLKEIAEGDLVTVLYGVTGTNTGEGNGLPATGKKIDGRGITIWRIVNGQITEEWSEFDQLRFMRELGLLPQSAK